MTENAAVHVGVHFHSTAQIEGVTPQVVFGEDGHLIAVLKLRPAYGAAVSADLFFSTVEDVKAFAERVNALATEAAAQLAEQQAAKWLESVSLDQAK